MSQSATKLLIVTDIAESSAETRRMVDNALDLQVVGVATSGDEALTLAKVYEPDVVVIDYDMPGLDGAETTRAILHENPSAMVIMLSVVNDADDIRHAMRAGARDYLLKPLGAGELVDTIHWLLRERREYARMQAFVTQLRKAYEALFTDDKPVPPTVVAFLEQQALDTPEDRLIQETLAVAYARNREWAKLAPMAASLAQTQNEGQPFG